ncbi:MAG: hypothetical protein L0Y68_01375 [Candidatus Dadabacteria bacterium]|nr:hypothetical protein [Candidatus Dadabacteria bacterium]
MRKKNNLGKFDLAVSSQEIWRTYEDASKQLLKYIKDQLLFNDTIDNMEARESWKAGLEVDIVAFRAGIEGLISASCNLWKHPPAHGGSLTKFYYSIKYSNESDDIIVSVIGLQEVAGIMAKAEKITEIKIDFSSSNENFIARMLSHVFAKVKGRIAVRNNLRIVHPDNRTM